MEENIVSLLGGRVAEALILMIFQQEQVMILREQQELLEVW